MKFTLQIILFFIRQLSFKTKPELLFSLIDLRVFYLTIIFKFSFLNILRTTAEKKNSYSTYTGRCATTI